MMGAHRRISPLVLALVVLVLGCRGAPATEAAPVDDIDWLVTFNSIGPVQVGTTFEQIEASLGPDFEITEAMPRDDWLAGYAVSLDGEVLLYFGTQSLGDPRFEFLLSDSSLVALDSGLRPGMRLDDAVKLHGELTLFDRADGAQLAEFVDGVGDVGETIYIETAGETVGRLWVVCFGPSRQSCPPPD